MPYSTGHYTLQHQTALLCREEGQDKRQWPGAIGRLDVMH